MTFTTSRPTRAQTTGRYSRTGALRRIRVVTAATNSNVPMIPVVLSRLGTNEEARLAPRPTPNPKVSMKMPSDVELAETAR